MTLEALIDTIPAYAKDVNLNFSSVVRQQTELTEQQVVGDRCSLRHGVAQ